MPTGLVPVIMISARTPYQYFIFLLLFLLAKQHVQAQDSLQTIEGVLLEKGPQQSEIPLFAAKVYVDKTHYTFTEKDGTFRFSIPGDSPYLYIRHEHIGVDTIPLTDLSKRIQLVYPLYQKIKDIRIRQKRFSTEITLLTPIKTERIGSKELLKAACCNLGESFETTPSVDVAFTDAITGYRQIQLLGLAGPYTLITRENIPEVRGLASITGLSFTPGQWIEGMQLSKGSGSVVNGFEGFAGQINVEWRKPMEGERIFFNLYQSTQGRTEANAYAAFEPLEGLYGNVYLHGKSQWLGVDQNHDHYLDQPLEQNWILANRWMWFTPSGLEIQAGARLLQSSGWGGSKHFTKDENPLSSAYWGMKQHTSRQDVWTKIGKLYKSKPWKSMGLQVAYSNHYQNMYFGRQNYLADEQSLYANYIFQTIVGNTGRVIKSGITYTALDRKENVNQLNHQSSEQTVGAFLEYAHQLGARWNIVAGYRMDWHNRYGLYRTPRLHIRYAPAEDISIRGSVGKAYRTASIFSENLGLLATNRSILIISNDSNGFYGLENEEAWNMGTNVTYSFTINYHKGTLSADYYYTHFLKQVVTDWEDVRKIRFYHSTAPSDAQSIQIQLDYALRHKLDLRLAYRYHNVMLNYQGYRRQKPLTARHRAFLNLAYETRTKWGIDYTLQWTGPKRIPDTRQNPEYLQLNEYSPSYVTMNIHINKRVRKWIELYAGIENIFNNMQMDPIIAASEPFGPYFDASLIWGPTMGRNIYAGIRLKK